ncbi:MAG TPA: S8 family serine peptidase [Gaiellaceae bacterium]
MRRATALIALAAALLAVAPAGAALRPIKRTFGETTLPRLRAGTVQIPAGHASRRVRVIVTLKLPPLAAAYGARTLAGAAATQRLDVHTASSRAYLSRVAAAQRAAAAQLRRAIPEARISRRFRIVLDGLTVSLPARRLPQLVRLGFVAKVYPSMRFTLALDRSPSVIGADVLHATTGARGDGVKIGVVDDGVDQTNPFFSPAGYSYPAGFPLGDQSFTTPKVIVARAFPGPGSGKAGQLPLDRSESFHGTHVAGIAAGDEGTTAPPGRDHPSVTGLSGVAPRAYIGNYRVFTVPTPVGNVANTPEIVAAFEAAVADGMNVINFSGGGPESDPVNDAMIETVRNVAAAGVVPVIAAGNDRDDFGLGSTGSPGTAPAGIAVAAVTNSHIFTPALTVTAPGAPDSVQQIPIENGLATPASWGFSDNPLVDVSSIVSNGQPADPYLCGPPQNPNAPVATLPAHSLDGAIALVLRGRCAFVTKSARAEAAGAIGIVLIDNRSGNANPIPIQLSLPSGMISDLDGARLRAYLAATGGRTMVRIGRDALDIQNGRSGIVTSFSSAGPTDFGHLLKPDVSAPGGQILSSTLPEFAGSPFAVFDGTSMATPHVAGAAALLVQRHPGWTTQQVKSALVSTAGAAWADTARTKEAPVVLEGGGLVNLPRADNPLVFTDPVSLSYGDLDVSRGARASAQLVRIVDAGGGAGTWQLALDPQSASAGATLDFPATVDLAPGGEADVPIVAHATAGAAAGDDYGFVVLRRGTETRRIPYLFLVTRPALAGAKPIDLKPLQVGDTRTGTSLVDVYRFPSEPFGPPATYVGKPMDESGAEQVYVTHLNEPAANVGVSVEAASENSQIDPWVLGSLDENDVQGYAGTPVDVNGLTFDYRIDVGAAAAVFPRQKAYYVAVDSGSDVFTGQHLPGQYLLRAWVNDVTPPRIKVLTTRVARGRPTIAARILDSGAGVDPLSLAIGYRRVLVGAAAYDPVSGLALFPLPTQAPTLVSSRTTTDFVASDFQETKNVNTTGANIMPNTQFATVKLQVVDGPAVDWLLPNPSVCLKRGAIRLAVAASATGEVKSVDFREAGRGVARGKSFGAGLYAADWKAGKAELGKHTLVAVAQTPAGDTASARLTVRLCK